MTAVDLYAVLGNPVAHSKSPRIHALFAAQCGQNLRYEKRLVALGGFADALAAFRAEGGRGCNVTVPFKFEAARCVQRLAPRAARAQAANTLGWDDEGTIWGDNTDGIGLVRDLARILMRPECDLLVSRRVLVLGAGGAAAGILGALIEAQAQAITVWNRTPEKAAALVDRHATLARECHVTLAHAQVPPSGHDIVINATATSLAGCPLDLPRGVLHPGVLAYDLMYAATPTPFVSAAQKHGAQAYDGLGMLVEQAAESFRLWRGIRPTTDPVLAQLRAELDSAEK